MWGSEPQRRAFGKLYPLWFGPSGGQDRRAVVVAVRPLADEGYSPALLTLALAHMQGDGARRDHPLAFELALRAAEQGYPSAQCTVGNYYRMARPEHGACELDPVRSVEWLRRAAEAGNAGALHNLAQSYASGLGVDRDPVEAFVHASLAVHCSAIRNRPSEVLRDRAAQELAPEALEEARRRFEARAGGLPRPWAEHRTYWRSLHEADGSR